LEALRVLGLEWGASKQAIKQAHRRLVKLHHPDLGGSAEAFRRVSEAYQRLVA
jgi:curved DNA-binding protein CbpA